TRCPATVARSWPIVFLRKLGQGCASNGQENLAGNDLARTQHKEGRARASIVPQGRLRAGAPVSAVSRGARQSGRRRALVRTSRAPLRVGSRSAAASGPGEPTRGLGTEDCCPEEQLLSLRVTSQPLQAWRWPSRRCVRARFAWAEAMTD